MTYHRDNDQKWVVWPILLILICFIALALLASGCSTTTPATEAEVNALLEPHSPAGKAINVRTLSPEDQQTLNRYASP